MQSVYFLKINYSNNKTEHKILNQMLKNISQE